MLRNKNKKGISLLIAVLISSVALLFSYAISNIALKEILLSQTGRDSQIAFYAANSGSECGLYWDLKRGAFSTVLPLNVDITCVGQTITATHVSSGGANPTHTWTVVDDFELDEGNQNRPCFNLIIIKDWNDTDLYYETKIESYGHNVCQDTSNRLERALRVNY